MNIHLKRQSFISRIRKSQQQEYFNKIRMTLLSEQDQPMAPKHLSPHGQQQILESIQAYRRQGQFLNFQAINEYISHYEGELREDFKCEVAKVVIEHYRVNGYAIASLAHILVKCEENHWLGSIDNLREKMKSMVEENLISNGSKLVNAQAISFLLFGLLNFIEHKEQFNFLPEYYSIFANSIGFFDQAFLLMLQTVTHCRYLLPNQEFVISILNENVSYGEIDPIISMILCQFLENYVCHTMTTDFCIQLSRWIGYRLIERKFSLTLKRQLIKIMTITLSYEFVGQLVNSEMFDWKIFYSIANIARIGNFQSKEQALKCLTTLVEVSSRQKIVDMVDSIQLIQILVYSLELSLNQELIANILYSLACILETSRQYVKLAKGYGLDAQAARLSSSQTVKIAQIASHIQKYYGK